MNEQWHDERRKELMNLLRSIIALLMGGTWSQFYDLIINK